MRRAQLAVYFSLLNENTLVNSMFDFNLIILVAKALFFFFFTFGIYFLPSVPAVSLASKTHSGIFLDNKEKCEVTNINFLRVYTEPLCSYKF